MNKHILSIALLLSAIPGTLVFATALPKKEYPPIEKTVEKNDITVLVGQEFEFPICSRSNRFNDEWHFASIELLNCPEEKQVGLELISQTHSKEFLEPYDYFWQTADCKLVCKFKANEIGAYLITFTSGKVMACAYFPEKFTFRVHVVSEDNQ